MTKHQDGSEIDDRARPRAAWPITTVGLAALLALAPGCLEPDAADPEPASEVASQDLQAGADYTLVGLGGKCMDVAWGASDNGTQVNLFDCNGTPAQRWHFASSDGVVGSFQAFGKCLDVPSSDFVDRAHLQLWDCNGSGAQRFRIFDTQGSGPDTFKEIRPDVSQGFCVEVAGGFTDNWTPIQLFDCNGTASQRWYAASPDQSPALPPPPGVAAFTTVTVVPQGAPPYTRPGVLVYDRALFEQGYRWSYRANGGAWVDFATSTPRAGIGAPVAQIQPNLFDDNLYDFKVTGFNAAGETASNVITLGTPLLAPTGLHVTMVEAHKITIAWTDNSQREGWYEVRCNGGCAPANPGPNQTSYTTYDQLSANTRICFFVSAASSYASSPAAQVCATTLPDQTPPPNTRTVEIGLARFQLPGGALYYTGTAPLSGTMTKLHVPFQSPITHLLVMKAGFSAQAECASPTPGHYIDVPTGSDVDLTALLGNPAPPIFNPTFGACALISGVGDTSQAFLDVTYRF